MILSTSRRIEHHPILGDIRKVKKVTIMVDGKEIVAIEGEPIASALIAAGIRVLTYTLKKNEPRGLFCAIGKCTDCRMTVDGVPNVRTCITPVKDGIKVQTQRGLGIWGEFDG